MVHLRSVTLWLGLIAVAEALLALALAAFFSAQAGLSETGSEAAELAGFLLPAGCAGLLSWVALSVLTVHRRTAAEAQLRSASRTS